MVGRCRGTPTCSSSRITEASRERSERCERGARRRDCLPVVCTLADAGLARLRAVLTLTHGT
jgi:hypothetical protein